MNPTSGVRDVRPLGGSVLRQANTTLSIRANRPGLHEITADVSAFVAQSGIEEGLLTIFCRHTSASLIIQENAAPAARHDIERFFVRIAPESSGYEHDEEGPDDMPAHLRSALTQIQLSIPVQLGSPTLGTWQGIFLFEHRNDTPDRQIVLHLIGERASNASAHGLAEKAPDLRLILCRLPEESAGV
jgi:secondary thiamine-phosphate synthase enzyme